MDGNVDPNSLAGWMYWRDLIKQRKRNANDSNDSDNENCPQELAGMIADAGGCSLLWKQVDGDALIGHVIWDKDLVECLIQVIPDICTYDNDCIFGALFLLVLERLTFEARGVDPVYYAGILRLLASPEALVIQDEDGMTPLHFELQEGGKPGLEIVKILASQETVLLQDSEGDTPLHHIARTYTPQVDCLRVITDLAPHALSVQNNKGELPLHLACSDQLVHVMLDVFPAALRTQDNDGNLPLHLAVGIDDEVIERMIRLYPKSLKVKNLNRALPIHRVMRYSYLRYRDNGCFEQPFYNLDHTSNMADRDPETDFYAIGQAPASNILATMLETSPKACALPAVCLFRCDWSVLVQTIHKWPVALAISHNRFEGNFPFDLIHLANLKKIQFVGRASKEILLAFIECVLNNTAVQVPQAAFDHVTRTIASHIPAAVNITRTRTASATAGGTASAMAQSLRAHWAPVPFFHAVFKNGHVQDLVARNRPFQDLLCGMYHLNRLSNGDRSSVTIGCMPEVVRDNTTFLFHHIRENPIRIKF